VDWSLIATPVGNLIVVAVICWAVADSFARTVAAQAIVRRLERSGGRYSFRTGWLTKIWNPARTVGDWAVMGRGRATYWLDDVGNVHLLYQPASGIPRHLSGPKPTATNLRKALPVVVTALAARAVGLASGAAIGYLVAAPTDRADGVLTGAVIGLLVGWNAWPVVAAIAYNRAAKRARRRTLVD
jgi:hypothetical protein